MAAKAALVLAFRGSGLTRVSLAERLGTNEKSVRRMLDPRHGTTPSRINKALRALGSELVVEVHELTTA
jgi:antitoxin HicB